MGLKGAAIGVVAGWMIGGFLGSLIGSAIGSCIESAIKETEREERAKAARRRGASRGPSGGASSGPRGTSGDGGSRSSRTSSQSGSRGPRSTPNYSGSAGGPNQAMIFCACAAAMLAKLAKADGVVTRGEIDAVERAFQRLGFSRAARDYAVNVFRKAKDDSHSIYEYAYDFANAVPSVEVRELLYELLWDVACADGHISSTEMAILRQIPLPLGIRPAWFEIYARERIRGYSGGSYGGGRQSGGSRRSAPPPPRDPLKEAYELLGASPSDDPATLKRKYRDLAKKYHPDALRAQGLPEEMIGKANEKMAKINAAWSEIKSARGL